MEQYILWAENDKLSIQTYNKKSDEFSCSTDIIFETSEPIPFVQNYFLGFDNLCAKLTEYFENNRISKFVKPNAVFIVQDDCTQVERQCLKEAMQTTCYIKKISFINLSNLIINPDENAFTITSSKRAVSVNYIQNINSLAVQHFDITKTTKDIIKSYIENIELKYNVSNVPVYNYNCPENLQIGTTLSDEKVKDHLNSFLNNKNKIKIF